MTIIYHYLMKKRKEKTFVKWDQRRRSSPNLINAVRALDYRLSICRCVQKEKEKSSKKKYKVKKES